MVFLVFCVALEIGLRLSGHGPVDGPFDNTDDKSRRPDNLAALLSQADRYHGWRHLPNRALTNLVTQGAPLITTDRYGFRAGRGWPGRKDQPIVVFLGNSMLFCAEVGDDETIPSQTAGLLERAELDVCALNAASRGYSMLQSLRMLRTCFEQFGERIVCVVYGYCDNDTAEMFFPGMYVPLLSPTLRRAASGGYSEHDAPYAVPDGTRITELRYVPHGWLERHSAIWHLAARPHAPDGSYTPLADDIGYWSRWSWRNGGPQAVEHLLHEMQSECRKRGALLFAASLAIDRDQANGFLDITQRNGVRSFDARQDLQPPVARYLARRDDGQLDGHFNREGARTVAEKIAGQLLPALEKRLDTTTPKN